MPTLAERKQAATMPAGQGPTYGPPTPVGPSSNSARVEAWRADEARRRGGQPVYVNERSATHQAVHAAMVDEKLEGGGAVQGLVLDTFSGYDAEKKTAGYEAKVQAGRLSTGETHLFDFEVEGPKAYGGVRAGLEGVTIGGGLSLFSAAASAGRISDQSATDSRVKVGAGIGWGECLKLIHEDIDGDGFSEWGAEGDVGPLNLGGKTEDPLGVLVGGTAWPGLTGTNLTHLVARGGLQALAAVTGVPADDLAKAFEVLAPPRTAPAAP